MSLSEEVNLSLFEISNTLDAKTTKPFEWFQYKLRVASNGLKCVDIIIKNYESVYFIIMRDNPITRELEVVIAHDGFLGGWVYSLMELKLSLSLNDKFGGYQSAEIITVCYRGNGNLRFHKQVNPRFPRIRRLPTKNVYFNWN